MQHADVKLLTTPRILGAGAVAIFAALPTNNMAVAYADVDTFLTDMEAAGFNNGDGNSAEITVGRSICAEVAGGMSPSRAADDLWQTSKMDQDGSKQFVAIAIRDLCPGIATGG